MWPAFRIRLLVSLFSRLALFLRDASIARSVGEVVSTIVSICGNGPLLKTVRSGAPGLRGDLGSNKWNYVAVWTYRLMLTVLSIRGNRAWKGQSCRNLQTPLDRPLTDTLPGTIIFKSLTAAKPPSLIGGRAGPFLANAETRRKNSYEALLALQARPGLLSCISAFRFRHLSGCGSRAEWEQRTLGS